MKLQAPIVVFVINKNGVTEVVVCRLFCVLV